MIIEKVFPDDDDNVKNKPVVLLTYKKNGNASRNGNSIRKKSKIIKKKVKTSILHSIKIMGLLNLFANVIDNFTHGIAVAGSFQASHKVCLQKSSFFC